MVLLPVLRNDGYCLLGCVGLPPGRWFTRTAGYTDPTVPVLLYGSRRVRRPRPTGMDYGYNGRFAHLQSSTAFSTVFKKANNSNARNTTKALLQSINLLPVILRYGLITVDIIDREFEFYEFFSFVKYNEFFEFFFG